MYKKDLKKIPAGQLRGLARSLKRVRDGQQKLLDVTQGVITHNGGRKEIGQHLRWTERQLNKVYEVLEATEKPPAKKKKR
jgi:ferritin-like metal-binding protein YciE